MNDPQSFTVNLSAPEIRQLKAFTNRRDADSALSALVAFGIKSQGFRIVRMPSASLARRVLGAARRIKGHPARHPGYATAREMHRALLKGQAPG